MVSLQPLTGAFTPVYLPSWLGFTPRINSHPFQQVGPLHSASFWCQMAPGNAITGTGASRRLQKREG